MLRINIKREVNRPTAQTTTSDHKTPYKPIILYNDYQRSHLASSTRHLPLSSSQLSMQLLLYGYAGRHLLQLRPTQHTPCDSTATPEVDRPLRAGRPPSSSCSRKATTPDSATHFSIRSNSRLALSTRESGNPPASYFRFAIDRGGRFVGC